MCHPHFPYTYFILFWGIPWYTPFLGQTSNINTNTAGKHLVISLLLVFLLRGIGQEVFSQGSVKPAGFGFTKCYVNSLGIIAIASNGSAEIVLNGAQFKKNRLFDKGS